MWHSRQGTGLPSSSAPYSPAKAKRLAVPSSDNGWLSCILYGNNTSSRQNFVQCWLRPQPVVLNNCSGILLLDFCRRLPTTTSVRTDALRLRPFARLLRTFPVSSNCLTIQLLGSLDGTARTEKKTFSPQQHKNHLKRKRSWWTLSNSSLRRYLDAQFGVANGNK
jgi:hypothetical protein